MTAKILAFAGSLRKDSYNKKLVKIACLGATKAGADVTYIDLKDYPLPLYDQDIEDSSGVPENAKKLKELMLSHDGFLLSIPEYNSSFPAAFKNVIDWTSRPTSPTEIYLCCFIDKAVTLMSASPGNLGGLRGLIHVRSLFSNLFSIVLPKQKCIFSAHEAFTEDGLLKNKKDEEDVLALGASLTQFIQQHPAPH